ncbi:MAG: 3-deoxy-manno-octulosonate cytidylyltransferase [Pseudomonadota bacterium]|nr:3-deoxy-manno-octulosonate cytidylyltransferase [Pseudomonadota bacterium]
MSFRVIIPVRFAAERLPGKPLLDLGGKSILQRVYEQCIQSGAESVVIATDDDRIKAAATKFGAPVCMTSSHHNSGTERLAEAVTVLGYEEDEVVINVQGDEPLIPPVVIHQVATNLNEHATVKVATLCEKITDADTLFNPDTVKVVMNKRGYALYFSRAPIAWERDNFPLTEGGELIGQHYRHVGIYGYRVGFLQEYLTWEPCPLEKLESLEQLRVLWNGGRIHVDLAKQHVPIGVDTEEDLAVVRRLL